MIPMNYSCLSAYFLLCSPVKLQYGSDAEEEDKDETDSEDDESEDEDGEELTPAVDAAILRTLARIKRKDPEIYRSEKSIFEGE
jgi:protein KRI1